MSKFTNFPKKFILGGLTFEVELQKLSKLGDEDVYGYLSMPEQKIYIATHMKLSDGEDAKIVELTSDMVWNTLYHELVHVCQFMLNPSEDYDEAQAQTYANFLCEYFKTVEY